MVKRQRHFVATSECGILHGTPQSLASAHCAAPPGFVVAYGNTRLPESLARAFVGTEAAVRPLAVANGIIINHLSVVAIRGLARKLPQLCCHDVRVYYGTRLSPGFVTAEPVVIGIVLGHTVLAVVLPAFLYLAEQFLVARNAGISIRATR